VVIMKKIYPYSAVITAYKNDETVDLENTRVQMRRQIKNGNNLLVCGTNGDFASLLTDEKKAIISAAVGEAAGKVRVIANAGAPSTFQTLNLVNQFIDFGVNAVAVINPYFIDCTQEGLYTHYSSIADKSKIPVYIYDIPARTQNGILPDTVKKLSKHENIAGIKDSSGKLEHLDAYCELASDSFEVLAGADSQILYGLKKGSSGCVSGLSNIVPEWVNRICTLFESGRTDDAEILQEKLNEFRTRLYALGFGPALVKRAVYVRNPAVGNNRSPSLVPDAELDNKLLDLLDEFGIEYKE